MKPMLLVVFASLVAAPVFAADPPAAAPAVAAPAATPLTSRDALQKRLAAKDANVVVLDVRSLGEYEAGHVPGAKHVPHDVLAKRLEELAAARNQEVVVYCRSGRRAALAEEVLRGAGFGKVTHLEGDFTAWEAEHRPVEKAAEPK
jgi:phage shock protein E